MFERILARAIPYTGTIKPRIIAIDPGYARVEMEDRRRVRNHLNSIHAIALANLGELTSGLALTATLPEDVRGIPISLHIEYKKKARGRLVAECRSSAPEVVGPIEHQATAVISNLKGEEVAVVTATWKLNPPAS